MTVQAIEKNPRATRNPDRKPVVVLGTIGHDAHIVGSSVLRIALEEAGFSVVFPRDPPDFERKFQNTKSTGI